MPQQVI
jgi:hypothetical protein